MNYWLVKSEPDTYGWPKFVAEGRAIWDGVRNYQARNNLRAMQVGDAVLFYHSVTNPAVVGLARVVREAYPDPTAEPGDTRWYVVELEPVQPLPTPVPLAQLKADATLADLALLRQSRLSVVPLRAHEYDRIIALSQ